MRWSEISARQPALGAVADRLLIEPGVLLAGTIRRDGTARISGVEPLVLDGDLWLSMMSGSAKGRDLGRDPRVVLNSVITSPSPPAEIKVRGTAHAVTGRTGGNVTPPQSGSGSAGSRWWDSSHCSSLSWLISPTSGPSPGPAPST